MPGVSRILGKISDSLMAKTLTLFSEDLGSVDPWLSELGTWQNAVGVYDIRVTTERHSSKEISSQQAWPLRTTLCGRWRYMRVPFIIRMVGRRGSKSVSQTQSIKRRNQRYAISSCLSNSKLIYLDNIFITNTIVVIVEDKINY